MNTAQKLTTFLSRNRESSAAATRVPVKKPVIMVAEPYPLLDPGEYVAVCTQATFEWAKRFGAWKVRLALEPQDYTGRPYRGTLCKFLDLGKNPQVPYAGPRSAFRMLWVEVNGEQPTRPDVDLAVFAGRSYRITVETVTKNRNGEPLAPEHWYSIVRGIHSFTPSIPFNPLNLGNRGNLLTDQPSNLENLPLGKRYAAQDGEPKDEFG
jgi:hypothetical protein